MNQDFLDLLRAFGDHDVRFLIVGAYALGVHGRPRATGDLDVWIEPTPENAARVMSALAQFGAPLGHVSAEDFSRPGVVYQMGLPPFRIDLLTELTGLTFPEAWPGRTQAPFGSLVVDVIGRGQQVGVGPERVTLLVARLVRDLLPHRGGFAQSTRTKLQPDESRESRFRRAARRAAAANGLGDRVRLREAGGGLCGAQPRRPPRFGAVG